MKQIFYTICFFILFSHDTYSQMATINKLENILKQHEEISYKECAPSQEFCFKPIPLTDDHRLHPYSGNFYPSFIITIPQAKISGTDGWFLIDHMFPYELIWRSSRPLQKQMEQLESQPNFYYPRVASIAQFGHQFYYHFMLEILGRLALLEMVNVSYDFLYVPWYAPFMKDALKLWGIDDKKIIEATENTTIQAQQLIIPSLVAQVFTETHARLSHYIPENIALYVRNKLLSAIPDLKDQSYPKRIFISRKDNIANKCRNVLNEDEVFALYEAIGFKRYVLNGMPLTEQIKLFYNADTIVGFTGSGLTNTLFCNPNTKIFEIVGTRRDGTIFYMSQYLQLDYHFIKTVDFIDAHDGQYDVTIPLDVIQDRINKDFIS